MNKIYTHRPGKRSHQHWDDASSDAGSRYKRSRSRKGATRHRRAPSPPPEPIQFPIFHRHEHQPGPMPTFVPLTGPAMRSVIASCLPEFVRRHWDEGMPCPSRQCILPPPPTTVLTPPPSCWSMPCASTWLLSSGPPARWRAVALQPP